VIVQIQSLDNMYKKNNKAAHFRYEGVCYNCGCHVEIEITKTFGNYALKGGILYETSPQDFMIICYDCHENGKQMSKKMD
jgi:hypothetical protein